MIWELTGCKVQVELEGMGLGTVGVCHEEKMDDGWIYKKGVEGNGWSCDH